MSHRCVDPEKDWMEKIFNELDDEIYECFGVNEGKSEPLILNFDFKFVF